MMSILSTNNVECFLLFRMDALTEKMANIESSVEFRNKIEQDSAQRSRSGSGGILVKNIKIQYENNSN